MLSIFGKKKIKGFDFIGVDIHSHILPAIDDGAADVATSISLVEGMQRMGFRKFIATPHIFQSYFPNTKETITQALTKLSYGLTQAGLAIDLSAAAEYMMDEDFEHIMRNDLLCISKNYVLIEMSYLYQYPNAADYLFKLQLNGYIPILAHPERYKYFHGKIEELKKFKDRGCLLQLNLLSLTGHYGSGEKQMALALIKAGMIDLVSSDLHHQRHLSALRKLSDSGFAYEQLNRIALKNVELFG